MTRHILSINIAYLWWEDGVFLCFLSAAINWACIYIMEFNFPPLRKLALNFLLVNLEAHYRAIILYSSLIIRLLSTECGV